MIRLVWRTDVHLSDVAPLSRTDDWTETVLGKLRQVGLVASRVGAAGVLDGGDFFHVKSPMKNSHALIRRVADVHRTSYNCPVFGNVGNHDCVYGDYSYLDQQPLGVLFSTGVFGRLYDEYEVFFGPAASTGSATRAYPFNRTTGEWAQGDPFSIGNKEVPIVRVVGVPYHGPKYDPQRWHSMTRGPEDFFVVVAHLLASRAGGTMFENEDIVRYDSLAHHPADAFLFGHWHRDQGIEDVDGKLVVNVGSLTRGALSQDEMVRKPACVVLSFAPGERVKAQVVRLKVADASAVFDVASRRRAEARTESMDAFVARVRQRLVLDQGVPLEDVIRGMDVSDRVRERTLHYLEQALSTTASGKVVEGGR